MQTKEPHERRRHALAWSAALTAVFAVVWLATLGVRLNTSGEQDSLSASAAAAQDANQPQLQISQDSVYSY